MHALLGRAVGRKRPELFFYPGDRYCGVSAVSHLEIPLQRITHTLSSVAEFVEGSLQ